MSTPEHSTRANLGLRALLTPKSMALLDSLPEYNDADSLALGQRLRNEGHSPELVAEALTQSRLRAKAREKFGEFASRMLFTAHGLEQATRLNIAAHHAARFRAAGISTVADLGCGIGGDTIAKAGLGITVIGVDVDTETVAIATVNTSLFPNVTIERGRAEEFDLTRVEGAWFDPARREDARGRGTRVHDPEEAWPPLSFIVDTAKKLGANQPKPNAEDSARASFGAVAAKLAPAIDHEHLVPGTETQWVSFKGQVLEACMYFGPLARIVGEGPNSVSQAATASRPSASIKAGTGAENDGATAAGQASAPGLPHGALVKRSALVISQGADAALTTSQLLPDSLNEDELRNPPVGDIGAYLYEPDGAIIRAGLLGTLARRIGAHTIDPSIAYFSGNEHVDSPFVRSFAVHEVLPFTVKKIAARLRELGVGTLEVKKRGADIDPALLRKQLKLTKKGPASATLIVTRAKGERVAIICDVQ